MKKLLIILVIIIALFIIWVVRIKTKPYTQKDIQRIIDLIIEIKKPTIEDYIRLDINHDLKFTLYDAMAVQKKILNKNESEMK